MSVHELITRLPAIDQVRRTSRALAMLDAVLSPDPESRYFSFDAYWSETEEAALMDNGSGDRYAIVFSPEGAFARQLEAFRDEGGPAMATVCLWRGTGDDSWQRGPVEIDGADELLGLLADGRPEAYLTFAEEYHDVALELDAVHHVYALMPLTEEIVTALNPEVMLRNLKDDITEIGYPRP